MLCFSAGAGCTGAGAVNAAAFCLAFGLREMAALAPVSHSGFLALTYTQGHIPQLSVCRNQL